ncbi:MAG: hypothetical protein B7Z73_12595 [Planctomycetia bacterium 21-64-5]|nr:MAG: hypothetical protein B7Z73_12595 [Planctomycetia bacterium 21-64-5]
MGNGVPPIQYYGDPANGPFPWLAWNDRPFISQYELMLVPVSSPASLLSDFGMLGETAMTNGEYFPGPASTLGQLPFAAFRHLLNFDDSQSPTVTNPAGMSISHLYRIFEYIHVPSRFTGTQTMLTPGLFSGANAGPLGTPQPQFFHPPFNWLPRYREPGRMNLNTTLNPLAFEGLMDNYPGAVANLWPQLLNSRQGFVTGASAGPIPNPMLLYGAGYPTYYANPFRPDSEVAFTPPLFAPVPPATSPTPSMTHLWMGYNATTPPTAQVGTADESVNATLLRMATTSATTNANPTSTTPTTPIGLLDDRNFDPNNTAATFTYGTTTTPYRDAGRDAYFQYQAYQRLGNLVTNRSNVYAIWITLGKFQVQPVAVSTVNPDGYQIIGEMGAATGDVQRERSFYIFDRSIPVGFVRGQNLNIEKAVLLEQDLD